MGTLSTVAILGGLVLFFALIVLSGAGGETCPSCGKRAVRAKHTNWRGKPDPTVADNPRRCIACGWPEAGGEP